MPQVVKMKVDGRQRRTRLRRELPWAGPMWRMAVSFEDRRLPRPLHVGDLLPVVTKREVLGLVFVSYRIDARHLQHCREPRRDRDRAVFTVLGGLRANREPARRQVDIAPTQVEELLSACGRFERTDDEVLEPRAGGFEQAPLLA